MPTRFNSTSGSSRRGGALVMALIVVMSVGMLATSFLQISAATSRQRMSQTQLKYAFYLAEAALAEAVAGVSVGKSGNVGTQAEPAVFGNGLFWVTATDLNGDIVRLDCTAMVGSATARLAEVLERGELDVGGLGLFSDETLILLPGTVLDGFDSERGTYRQTTGSEDCRLSSNASISISGTPELPTEVAGDVTSGPEGTVTTTSDVTIGGATGTANVAVELPAVETPSIELVKGRTHDSAFPLILSPGKRGFDFLNIEPDSELIVQGPGLLVVGELNAAAGATITFDTEYGKIDLYVTEGMSLAAGSLMATSGTDPSQVNLNIAGATLQPVQLLASANFYGVLYAPEAEVEVSSDFEVFGALIGKQLTFTGPGKLHFDQYLAQLAQEAAMPEHLSWSIVELSVESKTLLASDPFELLGLDRTTLPSPGDAHADQYLKISYLDGGGALHNWEGMESVFNWSDVDIVEAMTRDGHMVPKGMTPKAGALPPPPSFADLMGAIATSQDLRDGLIAISPLSPPELSAVLAKTPAIASKDLKDLLNANFPLPDATLIEAIQQPPLSSADLRDLLIAHSPLDPGVLSRAQVRVPAMSVPDLAALMGVQ